MRAAKKNSVGKAARKAALFTLLAATPALLNAQAQQIWLPKDSTGPNVKIARSIYISQKKEANQIPSALEYIGGFEVYIPKKPNTSIKINDEVVLSISEQKLLFQKPFIENGEYVFFYSQPVDYGGVRVFQGILKIFKMKQPAKNPENQPLPSDTLK